MGSMLAEAREGVADEAARGDGRSTSSPPRAALR
jgi:hypothetical protein